MPKENSILKIHDEHGNEKEYAILTTFKYKNKFFVLYTDYSRDEQKNIKVYAAIYNPKDETNRIEKITDEEDKNFINKYVKKLEQDLK